MNYNEADTVASGLVKPKTTAIFFDKLWLPYYSNIFINDVPDEILLMNNTEGASFSENDCYSRLYWLGIVSNQNLNNAGHALSRYYNYTEYDSDEQLEKLFEDLIDEIKQAYPDEPELAKRLRTSDFFHPWKNHLSEFLPQQPFGDELIPNQFLTSSYRNAALIKISKLLMKDHNIDMVPIFIDKTEFEKCLHDIDRAPFLCYEWTKSEQNINVLEICIKNIPYPVENNLTWEQVLDIRKDAKSVSSIRRLKNMLNEKLVGKSEKEVKELLDEAIDDHIFALKKHGVMTVTGGITTILSSAPQIINAVSNKSISGAAAGLAISAGIITFTVQQISNFISTKRQPIAFLHELNKLDK